MATRKNAVLLRVSTKEQEITGQRENVKKLLAAREVVVAEDFWFEMTESRRTVSYAPEFKRLMGLVNEDRIDTIFVERSNRFGTTQARELFELTGNLRDHGTKLVDLSSGQEMTEDGIASDVQAVVGAHLNHEQLDTTANFVLRSKAERFTSTASWPSGTQPFGYGKLCYSADGRLKWRFEPESRTLGQTFVYDDEGRESPGQTGSTLPKKERTDVIKLVPSQDAKRIEAIQKAFEWFTLDGLSYRAIAIRLNEEGYSYYGKAFDFNFVREFLRNPAYAGDLHFGKKQNAVFRTIQSDGSIKKLSGRTPTGQRKPKPIDREESERMIQEGVHEGLIDHETWERAKARIAKQRKTTTNHGARNPGYYLSGVLFCGHCGSKMVGRTDTHPTTKEKTVFYVCSAYQTGRSNGTPDDSRCGYHRIKHDEAEKFLTDYLDDNHSELKQLLESGSCEPSERMNQVISRDDITTEYRDAVPKLFEESVSAFVHYAGGEFVDLSAAERRSTALFYEAADDAVDAVDPAWLGRLGGEIEAAEQKAATAARKRIAVLEEEHSAFTMSWAVASGRQKDVLQKKCDELEKEIAELTPKMTPVSRRIEQAFSNLDERTEKRRKMIADLESSEPRRRGEAFKRIFERVEFAWDREWHPAAEKPTRERKTERAGRYSYTLRSDLISVVLCNPDLMGSP